METGKTYSTPWVRKELVCDICEGGGCIDCGWKGKVVMDTMSEYGRFRRDMVVDIPAIWDRLKKGL